MSEPQQKWVVYVPVVYSEVYDNIEAVDADEAIKKVKEGLDGSLIGETTSGIEHLGPRAIRE